MSTVPRPTLSSGDGPTGKTGKALVYLEWFGWALGFLYVPGLFFTLMFLLLPQMDEARVANMKLAYQDENAPFHKKKIDYALNLFKKGEAYRDKLRELTNKEEDLVEDQRQLDKKKRTEKMAQEEYDKLSKDLEKKKEDLNKEKEALAEENAGEAYKNTKAMRADKKAVDKEEEEWTFKKELLKAEKTQAETGAAARRFWYLWGLLFAVIMLMLGGIGYLSPKQGTWRRVVGAITIGIIVLTIAAKINDGHSVLFGAAGPVKGREEKAMLTLPTDAPPHTTSSRQSRPGLPT